ncbi:hypothetical protein H6783_01420 [Candidatus Nomurabacteria bacterium]|nr:hypothetical protein [Candidatus Nomurabacteria bacterium]
MSISRINIYTILLLGAVVFGVAAVQLFAYGVSFARSVEFGLSEMSPLGQSAGRAMPASGESVSCVMTFAQNPIGQGDNPDLSVAVSLDPSMSATTYPSLIVARCDSTVSACESSWSWAQSQLRLLDFPSAGGWTKIISQGSYNAIQFGEPVTDPNITTSADSPALARGSYLYRYSLLYSTSITSEHDAFQVGGFWCDPSNPLYSTFLCEPQTYTESGHSGTITCDSYLDIDPPPPPTECNDGINNDTDSGIDWAGIPSLPDTYDFNTQHPNSSYAPTVWQNSPTRIMYTVEDLEGDTTIISNDSYPYFNSDSQTANRICKVAGYNTAQVTQTISAYNLGTVGNSIGSDLAVAIWDGSDWAFAPTAGYYNAIYTMQCSDPDPGAPPDLECNGDPDWPTESSGPIAHIEVRDVTASGSYTGSTLQTTTGNTLNLQWWTTGGVATSCSGLRFSTGGAISGSDVTPSQNPVPGSPVTYRVDCEGPAGDSFDTVTVEAVGTAPSIESDPRILYRGEEANIQWNTNGIDPVLCSVSGPNLDIPVLSVDTGSSDETINNESTYTIDCGTAGSDSVTVRILPVIQET